MSILLVRSPHSFSIFNRSMIQADTLPLSDILNSELIVGVFEEEKIQFGIADEDVYTPAITLWAMISQCLSSETARSCKAASGRVVSLWAQIANRVVAQNAGNYCRAKGKIPISAIRKITRRLAANVELTSIAFDDVSLPLDAGQSEERLSPPVIAAIRTQPTCGRLILADGFTVDGPDTPANQAKYPQNPAQAKGLGFPILRCVVLISLVTGMLCDLAFASYSGKQTGETALLRQIKGSLRPGDTLVADSYYCTYWLIAMCTAMGVNVVMKNHHKREDHPLGAKRLNEHERLVTWLRPLRPDWMSKHEYRNVPLEIVIRLSDVEVNKAESRSKTFTLATTMLDVELCPREWLGSIYEGRWFVEPDIESVKCTMGIEHLRGQSPDAMERELWTGMLTYNLVRLKMLQSGYAGNREIRSMSFTETYQVLSTNWLLCACVGVSDAMAAASQAQGVCAIVGNRPGRAEPRENKRRPKTLKLMTVPRAVFKATLKAAIAALAALTKIP
jgi:hypothetical protein